jgi:hypothetical protein
MAASELGLVQDPVEDDELGRRLSKLDELDTALRQLSA